MFYIYILNIYYIKLIWNMVLTILTSSIAEKLLTKILTSTMVAASVIRENRVRNKTLAQVYDIKFKV